ncbi:MAG TPA: ribonuclease III [Candidatus Binatia bacterium]|nr:ribonuclease III [Candidatus Binatia bacterium]
MDRADLLAEQLGLPIRDRRLLAQALTHSSWLHEHPGEAAGHNERLEFLGDAVVNLAVSEALYARHPKDDEGVLSARRAAIVSSAGLATLGARINLGDYLLLGEGEAGREGQARPSILASAFEAVAGALLLDVGWEATRDWVIRTAAPEIEAALPPALLKSPKSRLQEATQRATGGRPSYRVLEAVGPDHDKVFRVEVTVGGEVLGMGVGPSRRVAETAAAAEAVEILEAREAGLGAGGAPSRGGDGERAVGAAEIEDQAVAAEETFGAIEEAFR